eukprot:CAMPEP_0198230114 /NCGR_PEP_ID=MMETSP1445-20131203/114486_1 /TAXON_ID=36898 /ORGANISM="Pyramimonas sp., Strain CCMP2087" /LENGTH=208 /DNA_ID=CAMNT_0043910621 /DNA_START=450 /DNA_END=1076 /DNA_ORIENTATION=-
MSSPAVCQVSAEKTVLVPIANGSEEMEAAIMVDVLRRAGAIVTVASVESDLVCTMSRNMKFVADCLITECENITYDLVALPGGMPGAERLRDSVPLMNIIKKQAAAKQPYAAMCAAPAVVLQPNGLLTGVAATAHPAFVDKIEGDSKDGRVVIDGNIITSRGPGTAFEFALAMVEFLFDSQKAKDVAGPMVLPPAVKASLVAKEWPGL